MTPPPCCLAFLIYFQIHVEDVYSQAFHREMIGGRDTAWETSPLGNRPHLQWQPVSRPNAPPFPPASPVTTKCVMAIGSLLNDAEHHTTITDGTGKLIHVAHHMNLDTLNQAYMNLSG